MRFSPRQTLGAAGEAVRVLGLLPLVELPRRRVGLHGAVALARRLGAKRPERAPSDRALLKRVIGAIDRRVPGGANCVRRALLEMALDGGAARERMFAGFRAGGGPRSGHAWLESEPGDGARYDAVIGI
jgi:hypothetical protein